MADDLARQLCRLPCFEWRDGMYYRNGNRGGTFRKVLGRNAFRSQAGPSLVIDLDHDANTGFLLSLAKSVCSKDGYWEFRAGCDVPNSAINRELARAIIFASPELDDGQA